MPERLAYDEAMRFARIRLQIQDSEINQGAVETITIHTKIGQIVQPWGVEGGFAVVYKFRTQSGQFRALRCFRRDMDPDMQFRYERIGPYFQTHAPQITAGFKYHAQGILVKETHHPQGKVYPVIEMEWIEGATLLDTVDELCRQRNQTGLLDLSQRWLNLLTTMRQARIAHGDLAGANVMVRQDGSLVLIDYDGVYIPDFAAQNLRQVLLGQADYQHPQMSRRPFNEHADSFSALVIYTTLLTLSWKPELWEHYTSRGSDQKLLDTGLLLKQLDFQEPQKSALFQELEQCNNQQARIFIQELKRACLQPVEQARFPFHLIESEELISALFARVLSEKKLLPLVRAYEKLSLEQKGSLSPAQLRAGQLASAFLQAYQSDNDLAIKKAYANLLQEQVSLTLSPAQQARVRLAQQCEQAREAIAQAIASRNLRAVNQAYDPILEKSTVIKKEWLNQINAIRKFIRVYDRDDDAKLLEAYRDLQLQGIVELFQLTTEERARLDLARQRLKVLADFRVALSTGEPQQIVASYQPMLDQCLTGEDQEILALAQEFVARMGDDTQFLATYRDLLNSPYSSHFRLKPQDRLRAEALEHSEQLLSDFTECLSGSDATAIVQAYNSLPAVLSRNLASPQQEQVTLAREAVAMRDEIRQAIRAKDDEAIRQIFKPDLLQRFSTILDSNEQIEVESAFKIPQIKENMKGFDYHQMLKLAEEIRRKGGLDGQGPRLRQAMRRLVRETCLTGLSACIQERGQRQGNILLVQWYWPEDELIKYVWVFWDADTNPRVPHQLKVDKRKKGGPSSFTGSAKIVSRKGHEANGYTEIDISRQKYIYTKACAAMYDEWDDEAEVETWCFSPPVEIKAQICRGSTKQGW